MKALRLNRVSLAASIAVLSSTCTLASLDQAKCLVQLQNGSLRTLYGYNATERLGLDNFGNNVTDANATAITYRGCVKSCGGSGQEPFDWDVFSQQFAAWLLPWLALLSQLPFGATLRVDNFMSAILTIGSPTLAAYSLMLTTLNGHHVASRFSEVTFPNAKYAVRILAGLQQAPLRLNTQDALLASLIVLPQNDRWWLQTSSLINYEHTWSISSFSGLSWVIVAYLLTVINSFVSIRESINSIGQAVGTLWLWLLAVVLGWLMISPKCDAAKLQAGLHEANESLAYVAREDGGVIQASSPSSGLGSRRAIVLARNMSTPLYDEECSPPIFNYARIFSWDECVEELVVAYSAAKENSENKIPVDLRLDWKLLDDAKVKVHPDNRRGTKFQITEYCTPETERRKSRWHSGVFKRMAKASFMALFLQWCTAGAGILVVWKTPTIGLGCRSGAYLLYAAMSTAVWMAMVSSSILSHYAVTPPAGPIFADGIPLLRRAHKRLQRAATLPLDADNRSSKPILSQSSAAALASFLNAFSKILAAANAVWVLCACMFQFTNVFNRCFCNSSVFYWGADKAYNVLELTDADVDSVRAAWFGGIAMAIISVCLFVGFVWIHHRPPQPKS